jgi:putative rhamnosyltransferase
VNALFGHFTYIPRRLFLYRRYTGAVTGATDRSLWQRATGFLRRRKPLLESSHLDSIMDVYHFYTEELSPEIKETFDHFLRFLNRSRWTNAIWVFKDRFRLFGKSSLLAVKVLLRPIR